MNIQNLGKLTQAVESKLHRWNQLLFVGGLIWVGLCFTLGWSPTLTHVVSFLLFSAGLALFLYVYLATPAQSSTALYDVRPDHDVRLWASNRKRIESQLFTGNIPTFVIKTNGKILDANPAFEVAFGRIRTLASWLEMTDNARFLAHSPQVVDEFGRKERVVFLSERFGKMVFTKFQSEILDTVTHEVIGYSIMLNINSISKRKDYLSALKEATAALSEDGVRRENMVRYDAAQIEQGAPLDDILALKDHGQILMLGAAHPGWIATALQKNMDITAVDTSASALRRVRELHPHGALRLVRIEPTDLPSKLTNCRQHFDRVLIDFSRFAVEDVAELLRTVRPLLSVEGQIALVTARGRTRELEMVLKTSGFSLLSREQRHLPLGQVCLIGRFASTKGRLSA